MISLPVIVFLFILEPSLALPMPFNVEESDPELTAGYEEGDMILDVKTRHGLLKEELRWPNNTVYYKFHAQFDEPHKNHILHAMHILETVSCIRFKEASDDIISYVNITSLNDGCYSHVGYLNIGPQKFNIKLYPLDVGCFRLSVIIHELMHTLGFYHMHNAANRDDYIYIAMEHIKEDKKIFFRKYNSTEVDNFDQEYDYASILHYAAYAFSADGEKTIIALNEEGAKVMGQRRGMTKSDINKLNVMYRCSVQV